MTPSSFPRHDALADRLDVVDALYRFAAGQDLRDSALFASSFAEDAELDFVQPARKLGVALESFRGRAAIVDTILATVARLDTTHAVTNPRVAMAGDRARLVALVDAMHLPRGDATRLQLKNIYRAELVRGEGDWRLARVHIENVWLAGDLAVLFG